MRQHGASRENRVSLVCLLMKTTTKYKPSGKYILCKSMFASPPLSCSSSPRYGTLPPAVVYYILLLYYCDVVWCPTTAKLTSMVERVHSKFVNKLPLSFHFKFSYSLTAHHRFHTFSSLSIKVLHHTCITCFITPKILHVRWNINRLFVPTI